MTVRTPYQLMRLLFALVALATSPAGAQTAPPVGPQHAGRVVTVVPTPGNPVADTLGFAAGYALFEDPAGRFALRVPPEWSILTPLQGDGVCFAAYTDDGPPSASVIVNVFCEAAVENAGGEPSTVAGMVEALGTPAGRAAFLAEIEADGFEAEGAFEYVGHGTSALGGTPAARIAYDFGVPTGEDGTLTVMHTVTYRVPATARGGQLMFTCGTTAPDASVCDAVAGTFTIESQP